MTNKTFIKSPLNYTGGKFSLLEDIITNLPQNINTFVDLFAGGFNVGINVMANKIICNDHNKFLIDIYRLFQVIDTSELINLIEIQIKKYNLDKDNKENYILFRKEYNITKEPLKLFILSCFSFNHQIRFNNKLEFNTPAGINRSSFNNVLKNNLIAFCNVIKSKNIIFTNNDFTQIPKLTQNDFVYLDPPYLISNATYNDGKRGLKNWTPKEEKQLFSLMDTLTKNNIKFMLSDVFEHKNQKNLLLIEESKKYNVRFLKKDYSNCNYHKKDKKSISKEVLITNY